MNLSKSKTRPCDECGTVTFKNLLITKRIQFVEFGKAGKTLKSRTVKFMCANCTHADPDWNVDPFSTLYKDRSETDAPASEAALEAG